VVCFRSVYRFCVYETGVNDSIPLRFFCYIRGAVGKQCLLLFLRDYNYNYNETYIYHVYILYKVEIIFPQNLLHYQHTVSVFASGAVYRSPKTLCRSVGALHARCVSVRRRPQNGVLGVHPSGGQKDRSRRVLSRD
jgi:hypothetical protein